MAKVGFDAPQKFGTLNPEVLAGIGSVFPEIQAYSEWTPGGVTSRPDLWEMLRPLHELILEEVCSSPGRITYRVERTAVDPGINPIPSANRWHLDFGRPNTTTLVVADTLPTEFLINTNGTQPPESTHSSRQNIIDRALRGNRIELTDEQTEELGLEPWQPDDFEVVGDTSLHIHRSPVNNLGRTVTRTWVGPCVYS